MRNKISKFFAVGLVGLFSVSLASCFDNNSDPSLRSVTFDFTQSARDEFNTNLITLPATKTLEIGTDLYSLIGSKIVSQDIFSAESIFQDYVWIANNDKIVPNTLLENDVTIYLDTVQTHNQFIINVILAEENPVYGLTEDMFNDYRPIVELDTDVASDENCAIRAEIEAKILETTDARIDQLNIDFNVVTNQAIPMINVTVSYAQTELPNPEYATFTVNFSAFNVDDRFTSHINNLEEEQFSFPNAIFSDWLIAMGVSAAIIRYDIVERINYLNDEANVDLVMEEADFNLNIETSPEQEINALFNIDVVMPSGTGDNRGSGSMTLSESRNDYNVTINSEVVGLTGVAEFSVPRFLSDARWNNASNETVDLYELYIFNQLTEEGMFELLRADASAMRDLREEDFTFNVLDIPAAAIFTVEAEGSTLIINDIVGDDSGTITDNTNIVNIEETPISFPRALGLDEDAISILVITQLTELLQGNNYVISQFVIETPDHDTALFNVVIQGLNVIIENITDEFEITDNTRAIPGFGATLLQTYLVDQDLSNILIPRALVFRLSAPSIALIAIEELNSRLREEVQTTSVFTMDGWNLDYDFSVTPNILGNAIEISDIMSPWTTVVVEGIPGLVNPIAQTMQTSSFQFNMSDYDNLLDLLEELMVAISTNGNFQGYSFALEEGKAVIGFSSEFLSSQEELLASNLMLYVNSPDKMPKFDTAIFLHSIVQEEYTNLRFERNETGYTLVGQQVNQQVNGHVFIPTFHNGIRVNKIGARAFAAGANVHSVTLPLFVERIEADAFNNSNFINEIRLDNLPLLSYIGDNAFRNQNQNRTRTIVLNNLPSLEVIGDSAFRESAIISVELRNLPNLSTIGNNVFHGSVNLRTITLENINYSLTWGTNATNSTWGNPSIRVNMLGNWEQTPSWWNSRASIFTVQSGSVLFANAAGQAINF